MAIEKEDWVALQEIIDDTWPDISFGYGQRIVLYHWWGDQSQTVANVLSVRKAVFGQPRRDILEAALRLKVSYDAAKGMKDRDLKALVYYNAGHIPPASNAWWITWSGNVLAYRTALDEAKRKLNL